MFMQSLPVGFGGGAEGRGGQQKTGMAFYAMPVSFPEIIFSASVYAAAAGISYPSERNFFLAAVREA